MDKSLHIINNKLYREIPKEQISKRLTRLNERKANIEKQIEDLQNTQKIQEKVNVLLAQKAQVEERIQFLTQYQAQE